jgi:hypothetical protein
MTCHGQTLYYYEHSNIMALKSYITFDRAHKHTNLFSKNALLQLAVACSTNNIMILNVASRVISD